MVGWEPHPSSCTPLNGPEGGVDVGAEHSGCLQPLGRNQARCPLPHTLTRKVYQPKNHCRQPKNLGPMMTWDKMSGWHLWKLAHTQLSEEKLCWAVSEEPALLLGVSRDGKLRKTRQGDGALTWKRRCGFSELPALLTPFGDVGWITQPQNYWQVQQKKKKIEAQSRME